MRRTFMPRCDRILKWNQLLRACPASLSETAWRIYWMRRQLRRVRGSVWRARYCRPRRRSLFRSDGLCRCWRDRCFAWECATNCCLAACLPFGYKLLVILLLTFQQVISCKHIYLINCLHVITKPTKLKSEKRACADINHWFIINPLW